MTPEQMIERIEEEAQTYTRVGEQYSDRVSQLAAEALGRLAREFCEQIEAEQEKES